MSVNYKPVHQVAIGDVLCKDCRGQQVSGTVTAVKRHCDLGVFVIATTSGVFTLNPFVTVGVLR